MKNCKCKSKKFNQIYREIYRKNKLMLIQIILNMYFNSIINKNKIKKNKQNQTPLNSKQLINN
jgi:hypothetical protein